MPTPPRSTTREKGTDLLTVLAADARRAALSRSRATGPGGTALDPSTSNDPESNTVRYDGDRSAEATLGAVEESVGRGE